ncbi:MAG TPA: S9 family peptidase [Xanthomonadaceae bacterium]|jgi:dipeptidyl aminopeptidase/acylaminoacyl peptidase
MKISTVLSALLACACLSPAFAVQSGGDSIEPYTRHDNFKAIKISPDGKHLAITVPLGDHTSLVILDPATLKPVSVFSVSGQVHVDKFWWANSNRLLVSVAEMQGSLDKPVSTGELFATNVDGKGQDLLFGYRAADNQQVTGTRIKSNRQEQASAEMVARLPDDPGHVLVAITPWSYSASNETYSTLELMDIRDGEHRKLGTLPLRGADVLADHKGRARFVYGVGSDDLNRVYYRENDTAPWVLINDDNVSNRRMTPMGFSADDSVAYVRSTEPNGPDSLQRFDVATKSMKTLLLDKSADPDHLLYADGSRKDPIGVVYLDDKPRVTYFDPESDGARSHRSLMASFDGQFVEPVSSTEDGDIQLLEAYSDRDPGDIFEFTRSTKKAELLFSRMDWFDPTKMAEQRPFEFKARDGLSIHGYLTLPPGSSGKSLPMVVYPHGGPFGIFDEWRFNLDAQLLAAHGYAVLQVNYRGSGNRGAEFEYSGYKQWGGKMQDDITDATHWAIDTGVADRNRICIYGASYGGYAALMGVAKEPTLYRCAVGYAGVYNIESWSRTADFQRLGWGKSYLKDAVLTDNLAAISPVDLADKIKVPVFLAAGGQDKRVPPGQTEAMEAALKKAGVPVQKLVFPDEQHGFYDPKHVATFDAQLLQFLNEHIGSGAH